MRVLAAADIHGSLGVYDWLAETVRRESADLLLLAGDLFEGDTEDRQREQARAIIAVLRTVPASVFYIMGNDDETALGCEDEQIKPLRGERRILGGYAFVGYPYCLPFSGGPFERPEEEIERDLRAMDGLLDSRSVFVSHLPAYGILDNVIHGGRSGVRAVAELLKRRPVLAHIHGHSHSRFGREGNRFNVACGASRRAMMIELPGLDHRIVQGGGSGLDGLPAA